MGTYKTFYINRFINANTISALGHFLIAFNFTKLFWYKNIIQYNKIGGTIKINSFFGKSFKFKEVKEVFLIDNNLSIINSNNKNTLINLAGISQKDIDKIITLFNEHLISKK